MAGRKQKQERRSFLLKELEVARKRKLETTLASVSFVIDDPGICFFCQIKKTGICALLIAGQMISMHPLSFI